jgi:hypothetical protein
MLFKRLYEDEAAELRAIEEAASERIRIYGSIEEYELAVEMDRHSTWNAMHGFTGLSSIIDRIRSSDDMTAAQAVEAYKASAQMMIDMTWGS